jgi:hypothetical protein
MFRNLFILFFVVTFTYSLKAEVVVQQVEKKPYLP